MGNTLPKMTKDERLYKIFSRTDGHCHICHKKLILSKYAKRGLTGAWQIEHSIPKAKGGTNHQNNLYAACITCNLDKGVLSTQTARQRHGLTRAPYSKAKKAEIEQGNIVAGALIGSVLGLAIGPVGVVIGGVFGGYFGKSSSPKI